MSNNCLIKPLNGSIGIYLHWCGDISAVTAFLEYAKLKGHRAFGGVNADGYGIARLAQIIGNFFGGSLSVGITFIDESNSGYDYDNGIYVVDNWNIVERRTYPNFKDEFAEGYNLTEFLLDIDNEQPEGERLGEEYLKAETIPINELKVGDTIFYKGLEDTFYKTKIVGIHNNEPYINVIGNQTNEDAWKNGNNYVYYHTYMKDKNGNKIIKIIKA
jgi:hypothetical protein